MNNMVDVSSKEPVYREAQASGRIYIKEEVINLIKENKISKGNVYEVAKTAAILAAKNTPFIIPFCHNIILDFVKVDFREEKGYIEVEVGVKARERTGVEMEALVATTTALLVIYDMCKPYDKDMSISKIKLIKKIKNTKDG